MKTILVVLTFVFSVVAVAVEVPETLINAIAQVESKGNSGAIGDSGKAVGKFQIWKTYVDEANRISVTKKLRKTFSYNDRFDPEKSKEMVIIYLSFWGNQYEKNTGKKATNEVLAKIHNGHAFWKRSANNPKNARYFNNLKQYWKKVKKELESSCK